MTRRKKIANSIDDGGLGIVVVVVIVLYLINLTLDKVPSLKKTYEDIFESFEIGFTIIFTIELIIRLAVYERPIKYLFSVFCDRCSFDIAISSWS